MRAFGIGRGLFRYLERCLSHGLTFRCWRACVSWFYSALEPLAPACFAARSAAFGSGDMLARLFGSIQSLENFYVRVAAPQLAAVLVGVILWFFLAAFHLQLAQVWLLGWLAAGVVLRRSCAASPPLPAGRRYTAGATWPPPW